jgi:hypothetical protein
MEGRGEFSFLIATQALDSGVIGNDDFAAAVWGAFISSLLAPFAFRYVQGGGGGGCWLKRKSTGALASGEQVDPDEEETGGTCTGGKGAELEEVQLVTAQG